MGVKGTGNKKHNRWAQNRQGVIKNTIGNVETKELIRTTHGHELRRGMLEGKGVVQGGGGCRRKKDNCHSIINKIYLKIKKKSKA